MGSIGVHFAVEPTVMKQLLDAPNDAERAALIEYIEESGEYDDWKHDTDKAWDALHRCLTNGRLEWGNGDYPLNHVVLGGQQLYEAEDYVICLTTPEQVIDISKALITVSKKSLREIYQTISCDDYDGPLGEEDFEYTWENFEGLPSLFQRAANAGRAVIFTVSQ